MRLECWKRIFHSICKDLGTKFTSNITELNESVIRKRIAFICVRGKVAWLISEDLESFCNIQLGNSYAHEERTLHRLQVFRNSCSSLVSAISLPSMTTGIFNASASFSEKLDGNIVTYNNVTYYFRAFLNNNKAKFLEILWTFEVVLKKTLIFSFFFPSHELPTSWSRPDLRDVVCFTDGLGGVWRWRMATSTATSLRRHPHKLDLFELRGWDV